MNKQWLRNLVVLSLVVVAGACSKNNAPPVAQPMPAPAAPSYGGGYGGVNVTCQMGSGQFRYSGYFQSNSPELSSVTIGIQPNQQQSVYYNQQVSGFAQLNLSDLSYINGGQIQPACLTSQTPGMVSLVGGGNLSYTLTMQLRGSISTGQVPGMPGGPGVGFGSQPISMSVMGIYLVANGSLKGLITVSYPPSYASRQFYVNDYSSYYGNSGYYTNGGYGDDYWYGGGYYPNNYGY